MEIKELADLLVSRLDKLESKVDDARETLAGQTARTNALEAKVEAVVADVKPLKEHAWRVKGAVALISLAATVVGLWKLLTP